MTMKNLKNIMALCLITVMCACSHKPAAQLVGSDRDEHGCIASAGYCWSEALKDCVRLWEVGVRADNGGDNVYVVFSNDSSVAEVFAGKDRVLCRRDKESGTWKSKKKKTGITITDGILKVCVNKKEFVQNKK